MITRTLSALALAAASTLAFAQEPIQYEIAITNLTEGQTFTPQLVVTHSGSFQLFRLGRPASEALAILAEGGDTGAMTEAAADAATDSVTIDGLLAPGQVARTTIMGVPGQDFISMAAMLIPTNDAFVAMNRVRLPLNRGFQRLLTAYDSGSEDNNQSCQYMPGPRCGGEGFSEEDGEGFVHVSNGFHSLGDTDDDGFEVLGPATYDWRNPVARITVRRMN